jgi:hypothetical protein
MFLLEQKIVILVVWQYAYFPSIQLVCSTYVMIIVVDCVKNMFRIIIVFGKNVCLDLSIHFV